MGNERERANLRRRGTASIAALIATIGVIGVSGAVLAVSLRAKDERNTSVKSHKALVVADSGLSHAIANLRGGVVDALGSADAPLGFGGGTYWATFAEVDETTYRITSVGNVRGETIGVEAVLRSGAGGIYDNAIFAGNSSDDPNYVLELGGTGTQADEVYGDIYSGGDVAVEGDADVSGTIRATGVVTGASGEGGVYQAIPDLAAQDYENTADFDVGALFSSSAWASDAAGGWAQQVDESNPAHIFRRNPTDRGAETGSTVKDDYFLEDPYEPVRVDATQDGSDPYTVSLSGISGEPGPNGNRAVYYIDGNLWLHNKKSFSFMFEHDEPNGVQVTFVVKGNIYFSDNLFYENPDTDGLAFIAMKDDAVEDSGNVYFGDPEFGTLQSMSAFMYAENNFYDVNLDASGSSSVHLYGNMTAGNQVLIERDWHGQHTKLAVDFDERISLGDLEMPGLPQTTGGDGVPWNVVAWRVLANP